MTVVVSRRRFLFAGLVGSWGVASSGCGTILYPERIGQPPGMLDWKVVALDTIGLLLFVVPGVIAFVVDFYNGTIFLPQGYYGHAAQVSAAKLVSIRVSPEQLDRARIEQIVSKHVERDVSLVEGQYRTCQLESLDDFWSQRDALAAENS